MAQESVLNHRYTSVKYIGQGTYGVVASVICKQTGESRAIKLVDTTDVIIFNEINVLCQPKYQHENIIRYYGSCIFETWCINEEWKNVLLEKFSSDFSPSMIALELELCVDTLAKVLQERNSKYLNSRTVVATKTALIHRCMKQVANGLKFLHSFNLVHRDIKPANILYDQQGNWKIGDLGHARMVDSAMSPNRGSWFYMAPEQNETDYDTKVDVFAFGIIIFEICYPFGNTGDEKHYKLLRKVPPILPNESQRLGWFSSEFDNLIRGMIQKERENRTCIEDVVTFLSNNL